MYFELSDGIFSQMKYDELAGGEFMRLEDWLDDRCYEERQKRVRDVYETMIEFGVEKDAAIERTASRCQLSLNEVKSILTERIS